MRKIQFAEFITLQRGFDLPRQNRTPGPVPVIGAAELQGTHTEPKVNPPVVTTGRSGTLGEVMFTNVPAWPLNTCLWVKDFKGNDPKYVYYLLKTLDLAQYNAGAGVPTLNRNHLDSLPLNVHGLPEQRRIASILSAYDDLIENNTRRIAILEEMARRVYEEWFVHFRFPGHEGVRMVESELGLVPDGWDLREVKDIVIRLPAGKVYKEIDVNAQGQIPVVDQSTSELLGFHDGEPDHQASAASPVVIFGDHTCKMQLMVAPFSLGPNTVPFVAREFPVHYVYSLVRGLVTTHEYKRHWSDLMKKSILVARKDIAAQFADAVRPLTELTEVLGRKNRNLRTQRDLFLPKLISGEIDVSSLPEPEALAA